MSETITLEWTWEHGAGPMIQQDIIVEFEVAGGIAEIKHVGSSVLIQRTRHMLQKLPAGTPALESRNVWLADNDPLLPIIMNDLIDDEKLIARAIEDANEIEAERRAEDRAQDRLDRGWSRRFA